MVAPTRNQNYGAVLPTTQIWDVSEVINAKLPAPLEELLVRMYQNLNLMAQVISVKDTGYYPLQVVDTSQKYFPNPGYNSMTNTVATQRPIYRKVVITGPLPTAAGTNTIPHWIEMTANYRVTRIGGWACILGSEYVPLPYASATGDNVEVYLDQTNIYITVNSTSWASYTESNIIIEFIQS